MRIQKGLVPEADLRAGDRLSRERVCGVYLGALIPIPSKDRKLPRANRHLWIYFAPYPSGSADTFQLLAEASLPQHCRGISLAFLARSQVLLSRCPLTFLTERVL